MLVYPRCLVLRIKYNKTCFAFWKILRLGNWHGIFWGLIFDPGIFFGGGGGGGGGGSLEALGIFFGFKFSPIRSYPTPEIWSTTPRVGSSLCKKKNFHCFYMLS